MTATVLLLVVKPTSKYFINANLEYNYEMYYPTIFFHLKKLSEDNLLTSK